jgi:hypothetical protein
MSAQQNSSQVTSAHVAAIGPSTALSDTPTSVADVQAALESHALPLARPTTNMAALIAQLDGVQQAAQTHEAALRAVGASSALQLLETADALVTLAGASGSRGGMVTASRAQARAELAVICRRLGTVRDGVRQLSHTRGLGLLRQRVVFGRDVRAVLTNAMTLQAVLVEQAVALTDPALGSWTAAVNEMVVRLRELSRNQAMLSENRSSSSQLRRDAVGALQYIVNEASRIARAALWETPAASAAFRLPKRSARKAKTPETTATTTPATGPVLVPPAAATSHVA